MVIEVSLRDLASVRRVGRDYYVQCPASGLKRVLSRLVTDFDCYFINSISGVDAGSSIDVIYHLTVRDFIVSVKVSLPRSDPKIGSVTGLFPGAALYERELMEMLGVKILDHPTGGRLFLPDDFPEVYPLRKESLK